MRGHHREDTATRSLNIGGSAVKEEQRILVVDDDCDSTQVIKILLEKIGGYLVLEENDAPINIPELMNRIEENLPAHNA